MNARLKNFIAAGVLAFAVAAGAGAGSISAGALSGLADAASLFLPSSYEQYLSLVSPADAAFSDSYIAVADGSTLYLYDREEGSYSSVGVREGRTISKIGFAGERLFVADTGVGNFFYEYDFGGGKLDLIPGVNCSTFCVDGDTLYTATVSTQETRIGAYSIEELASEDPSAQDLGVIAKDEPPKLAVIGHTLYCVFGESVYYPDLSGYFRDRNFYFLSTESADVYGVVSACSVDGALYYAAEGGLYRSDSTLSTAVKAARLLESAGIAALTAYQGKIYAVYHTGAVREIAVTAEGAAFTGYEISAASPSAGRLSSATETARAGDLLVVADGGNSRISVYRASTGEYGEIPCVGPDGHAFAPTHVATDGSIIAVSSEYSIYLYRYGETNYYERRELSEPALGLACVYGACYYITEYSYGKVEEGQAPFMRRDNNVPRAICADVYGTVYVVNVAGEVQAYSEADFNDPSVVRGETVPVTLPEGFTSLRADFEGNLYCLADGALYKNGEQVLSLAGDFVYGEDGTCTSFALGFEDDAVYFLFGNYMVVTKAGALDIPTLDKISAEGVYEDVYRSHGSEDLLIDIPAGSIGIRTDLESWGADDAYFPYRSYYRTEEDTRGILLAVKDRYALVILYEIREDTRYFTADLFRLGDDIRPLPQEEYWEEEGGKMYLTNEVSSYYYPCLHDALRDRAHPRSTRVEVLGYVTAPERKYALVRFDGGEQEGETGFVPASYLTVIPPDLGDGTVFEPAFLKANKAGAVFRSEDGEELTVTERVRADLFEEEDGYLARIYSGGKAYYASVPKGAVDRGESDILRISLIVILSVIAVGIIGAYVFLLPAREKRRRQ